MICLVLVFIPNFNSLSETKKFKLSDNFLDSVINENLTDKEHLIELGFESYKTDLYVKTIHVDNSICDITVDYNSPDSHGTTKYKNITYDAKVLRTGLLSFERLSSEKHFNMWFFHFFINGAEITVSENTYENDMDHLVFQSFLSGNAL
ncbi:MAG: hypothetical protein QM689_02690 [Oscillospiraceae bacterium]